MGDDGRPKSKALGKTGINRPPVHLISIDE